MKKTILLIIAVVVILAVVAAIFVISVAIFKEKKWARLAQEEVNIYLKENKITSSKKVERFEMKGLDHNDPKSVYSTGYFIELQNGTVVYNLTALQGIAVVDAKEFYGSTDPAPFPQCVFLEYWWE